MRNGFLLNGAPARIKRPFPRLSAFQTMTTFLRKHPERTPTKPHRLQTRTERQPFQRARLLRTLRQIPANRNVSAHSNGTSAFSAHPTSPHSTTDSRKPQRACTLERNVSPSGAPVPFALYDRFPQTTMLLLTRTKRQPFWCARPLRALRQIPANRNAPAHSNGTSAFSTCPSSPRSTADSRKPQRSCAPERNVSLSSASVLSA